MSKGIYVATIEPNSGKSVIVLGLMRMLLGKTAKVGYFRPIIEDLEVGEMDNHINTVVSHFEIDINYKNTFAFTRNEVLDLYNQGKSGKVIDEIIKKYKYLESRFDFVLVEGTDFSHENSSLELDINILISKNLSLPVIIVSQGDKKDLKSIVDSVQLAHDTFKGEVDVLSLVTNKVDVDQISILKEKLQKRINTDTDTNITVIPKIKSLASPTIKEIVKNLNGNVLFGKDMVNNQAENFSVGAMQLRNYLTHLKENALVITPGDRADIILGALQAHISKNYPKISGIVLTGGLIPEESILKLIEGLSSVVPIISVKSGTFSVTNTIGKIKSKIYADNIEKIEMSIATFEKHVDTDKLSNDLITFQSDIFTPRMFQYNLLQRALNNKKHIVLPEGDDERVLRAAARLIDAQVVELTLIGDEDLIKERLITLDIALDTNKINIVSPTKSPYFDDYVNTLYELRKHKNVNLEMARDMISDVSYFGTMMIYKGHADGMVSGAVHTTQHTLRPALQFIKTKPDVNIVSSVFFMCLEDRISVFGDCAINPNPNAEQLAEIAISSAETAKNFGIEPKVAMLSYSSGASGKGADVEKVREATEIVKKLSPSLKIEGPIQYDAAVDMRIGKSKLPDSEVAGSASVLIFPDLNTGNNTYKAVQRETGALAIGPVLQGLNKPVNDLSRGCTADDIYSTVIITAIQAQDL
ncbi:phosphate acetyltransferase [Algibacter lectus]|uniref:Phosphate acetyltransferase n=1 Tax=Algibacter lectus TaxID=221126 RepID=A0A4R8MFI1_9FLAO|nr:phosphate acetyltransferase [Algibacter lectus]MWW24896.1 phosphate acetyltransferase [Algibacter lectus]TDY64693.1 phosphate acetyltransferase [Algibacter lectus]SFD23455.1 phosphate acetyltransferase [Algibacter lectus]